MTMRSHLTFWQRWKRGAHTVCGAAVVGFLGYYAMYLPGLLLGEAIRSLPEPWNEVVGFCYLLLLFAATILFLPVGLSYLGYDPLTIRETYAAQFELHVDELVRQVGVPFDKHFFAEVERLLDAGDRMHARRVYREATGATWEETDHALADLITTRVERKLFALREHLQLS